ncbi:MAG: gliding motility-associated protein GldE [Microscillaceae bacterium]|nr:gliding motility-associated protein GldE [Microscillaceae bacterium]
MDTEADTGIYFLSLLLNEIARADVWFYAVYALVLLLLLLLSAIASGSELAMFSLSEEKLHECRASEFGNDQLIIKLHDKPQLLLATLLIFNNLVNMTFVIIATSLTWFVYDTHVLSISVTIGLTSLMTILLLFFGEILPKVYASQQGLSFIRSTIFFIYIAYYIFLPISVILVRFSDMIKHRVTKKGYKIHIEELPEFIDEMRIDEATTEKDKEILKGIVNFGSISVNQIMTSRTRITAFEINMSFSKLLEEIKLCGYSRIPIYRDTIDKIEGILYVKDLLPFLEMNDHFKWNKLLRPRYFVPENKKIDKLLKDFQEKHVHMAVVVDEYGGTAGLITLEDIIEEIVGEINDEFDDSSEVLHNQIDEHTYSFEGKISLYDFCKILNIEPGTFDEIRGDSKSLGGLMLELFSKLPQANEEITFQQFKFIIEAVSTKQIEKIKVEISNEEE